MVYACKSAYERRKPIPFGEVGFSGSRRCYSRLPFGEAQIDCG